MDRDFHEGETTDDIRNTGETFLLEIGPSLLYQKIHYFKKVPENIDIGIGRFHSLATNVEIIRCKSRRNALSLLSEFIGDGRYFDKKYGLDQYTYA